MESRIQFRVDAETKRLAQMMAESQGRTLSDAYRELTHQLADEQRKKETHEQWLTEQVNQAFEKLESGQSHFVDHDQAKNQMELRKARLRNGRNK
ncbi:damage-inducible protein J [Reinekea marinisedimentorum]|uniref:RelB antitoxin of RelBE toxin-antitoxin system n=1 Tax=Reinekea marinisedimentorum TaxID=230495 RepID=A0A4R3I9R4_9GAMM|nr:damage-inducible protein J [Reinekea marinisedimentorum]TCS42103.1 hypothetical protein BCF53_104208 [Reinekea marinisedimentorum]